jgi:branched-chain amino acid transport system permease protein
VGPIVGGFVLTALPEVLRAVQEYRGFFNGLVLLVVIVFLPGGLIDPAGWRNLWSRFNPDDDNRKPEKALASAGNQKDDSHAGTD